MEVVSGSLYDWPKYYDFAYGSDTQAEIDFLVGCFSSWVDSPVNSVFEPACGTGRLLFRLAQRNYHVAGLDLNAAAVDFCNERMRKHGLPPAAEVGDMSDFCLNGGFDAAFNTINSFRHLRSHEQAISHLRCMCQSITRGGIYVLGLHLTPTTGAADENEFWSHRRGHLQLNTSMWLEHRDLAARIERFTIAFDVYTPTRQFRIQDQLEFRTYTLEQFERLIDEAGGLEIAEVFDFTYQLSKPIELTESTQDAVFILRRR